MLETESKKKPPLVLVVDDDATVRILAREALEQDGFLVEEAENGNQALRAFHHLGPDLVLLDVMMPEMDGFTTCSMIRSLRGGQITPVLMVTGLDDTHSINRAYEVGATDFITKPINWEILKHRVRYILRASRAFAGLKKREEENRALLDALPDTIFQISRDGILVDCQGAKRTGLSLNTREFRGKAVASIWPPDVVQQFAKHVDRAIQEEGVEVFEYSSPVDNKVKSYEARLVRNTRDVVTCVIRDITGRRQAEEVIKTSEEKMRRIIESSPIGIRIVRDDRYVYVNPACVRMFGYESADEIVGLSVEALYAPEQRDEIKQRRTDRLAGKKVPSHYETKGLKKNGEHFDLAIWVTLFDYLGETSLLSFLIDTSAEKSLRAQLLHAQKMEAIGTLAGGISHDFNNLLQTMLGWVELTLRNKSEGHPDYESLQRIANAVQRASELTKQLLTFSRKIESEKRTFDLNQGVREAQQLLERTIPKMIDVEPRLTEHLNLTNADPTQIQQILLNLAINARDAMPNGGNLIIETGNVTLDPEYCRAHLGAKPGEYVLLAISDTGNGMDTETLKHIFEPFFTTKEVGKGTGLGLAMVYGIVKAHDGYITCDSELGKGTIFKIYFPVISQRAKETEIEHTRTLPGGGSETILVVDDNEEVQRLNEHILTEYGYSVVTAPDGKTAVEIYRSNKRRIDLVILDLIMPGMGGLACLRQLLEIDPDAKVIIATGQFVEDRMKEDLKALAKGFVDQPYQMRQLLKAIRDVMKQS